MEKSPVPQPDESDPSLDPEVQTTMENAAGGEFEKLKASLKKAERIRKLQYLRSLGRSERLRLKLKYNANHKS